MYKKILRNGDVSLNYTLEIKKKLHNNIIHAIDN